MMFSSPTTISLSPNTEPEDIWLAFALLFQPWRWKRGSAVSHVITWFEERYPKTSCFTYNSGRSALYHILQSFDITQGDEVIVQSFTCVAVPNSILWNNATPIYCDIDERYNLSLDDIKKKTTKRTKAIIIQHTFGIPAEMEKIVKYARSKGILVIEDCAHALGASYNGKLLGSWGDAAFFSFGRDKVLSSVFGGLALVPHSHAKQIQRIKKLHSELHLNSTWWIFQQVFHPVAFSIILPLYHLYIGKVILYLLQRLNLLSFPVYQIEKLAKQPQEFPALYPNVLALLLLTQLKKLSHYNESRQRIAMYYRDALKSFPQVNVPKHIDGAIYLRFPIRIKNPKEILANARKRGLLLGNWYHNVIDPIGTDFSSIEYDVQSCPDATLASKEIVNLPTRITQKQAEQVVNVITYSL